MTYLDKAALFKRTATKQADVEVPDVGTVRVRALTRAEALGMTGLKGGPAVLERKLLAAGMVDPAITEDEAEQWQQSASADAIRAVSDAIATLSGMFEGAQKSGVPADGNGPVD